MKGENRSNLEATLARHRHKFLVPSPIVNPRFVLLNQAPPNLDHDAFDAGRGERLEGKHHRLGPQESAALPADGIHRQRDEHRRAASTALRREVVVQLVGDVTAVVRREEAAGAGGLRGVEA